MKRPAIAGEALEQLFRSARTANDYAPGLEVTDADCRAIYDLVKMAPTSANSQPGRFVWCISQESRDRLADCATGSNPPKIRGAPAAVVIGMDLEFYDHLPKLFPHTDARSWFAGNDAVIEATAFRNSSLQGAYFIIAARALGFDVGPMSGFNADAVDTAFFPHSKVRANFIATFGVADPTAIFARSPRPSFDQFNRVL